VTTIRVHPPVETPAGLVVALPPEFSGEGVGSKIGETDSNRPTAGRNAGTDPTVPDVFALAVPCPTCDGATEHWWKYLPTPCESCDREGWVHHGDYRVLRVVPLVEDADDLPDPVECIDIGELGCRYWPEGGVEESDALILGPVPGAVPGGVALIVEKVSGEGVGSKIGETDSNRPTAGRNAGTDPTVPDVFALVVPCPTCEGTGLVDDLDNDGAVVTCEWCVAGWVHHAQGATWGWLE
jgi:hypothetical protein